MKLAFCLYKYFPFGGLQRDFLRIALACQARGHTIRVYTLDWEGDVPLGFDLVRVPVRVLRRRAGLLIALLPRCRPHCRPVRGRRGSASCSF